MKHYFRTLQINVSTDMLLILFQKTQLKALALRIFSCPSTFLKYFCQIQDMYVLWLSAVAAKSALVYSTQKMYCNTCDSSLFSSTFCFSLVYFSQIFSLGRWIMLILQSDGFIYFTSSAGVSEKEILWSTQMKKLKQRGNGYRKISCWTLINNSGMPDFLNSAPGLQDLPQ